MNVLMLFFQNTEQSSTKKTPIYHNAHKLYNEQQKQNDIDMDIDIEDSSKSEKANNVSGNLTIDEEDKSKDKPVNGEEDSQDDCIPDERFSLANLPQDLKEWKTEQVAGHLAYMDPTLRHCTVKLKNHGIDGEACELLNHNIITKFLDIKLGPALKILNIISMIQGRPDMRYNVSTI